MRVAGWALIAMVSLMPIGSGAWGAPGASNDGYKEGLAAVKAGRWDDAISALRKGPADSKHGMTCYLLAFAYTQKKDYEQTHTYAACAVIAKPALAEPYAQAARDYLSWSGGIAQAVASAPHLQAPGGYHLQLMMSSGPQGREDAKREAKARQKAEEERKKAEALESPEAVARAAAAYRAANPCSDESRLKTPEQRRQCISAAERGGAVETVPEGPRGSLPPG